MWKNYFTIVYRSILRQKLNSFINILGLAAGVSAAALIFLYVDTEIGYDKNWEQPENLFRVNETFDYYQKEETPYALVSFVLGTRLREFFPDDEVCRTELGRNGRNIFVEDTWVNPGVIRHADDNFFRIFTFPHTIFGNVDDTLPRAWVEQRVYETYFARFNANLFVYGNKKYALAGVFSKKGYQSHLEVDVLLPFDSVMVNEWSRQTDWSQLIASLYMRSDLTAQELEYSINSKFSTEVDSFVNRYNMQMRLRFPVIAVPEIHFSSDFQYDSLTNGDRNVVWIFTIVGLLIIIIASINYVNMAIAQGGIRAREIAIRKTMGATRKNIIIQFLGESVVILFFAIVASFVIIELLFPGFNELTGFHFTVFESNVIGRLLVFLFFVWILLSFFSGFYPAFVLSQFQPITIFRGGADLILFKNVRSYFVSSTKVRKTMLVAQYVVAGTIIVTTIIIQFQTNYLFERDLGFDINKLVVVELENDTTRKEQYTNFLSAVKDLDYVESATIASRIPGLRTGRLLFTFNTSGEITQSTIDYYSGNPDLLEVMGCELVSGRWFDVSGNMEQVKKEVIVNESFVEYLGWNDPLGRRFRSGFIPDHLIVGVVKDFNYYSLHKAVSPLVVVPYTGNNRFLIINSSEPDLLISSGQVHRLWAVFFPSEVLTISRLRDSFNSQYNKETKLLHIFTYFSGLAIIISSLGLFALSAFSVQRRIKEISIRKILGAERKHIIRLLYVDYFQIFILSSLLGWGAAFLFSQRWLNSFVSSVSPGIAPYLLGAVVIFFVAFFTVSYHTFKAIQANPAQFLNDV